MRFYPSFDKSFERLVYMEKILGDKRREVILEWLKNENRPITGGELASRTNVSRQVIVQDISLLKALGEPILATSQGYMYLKERTSEAKKAKRLIACKHAPEKTKEELNIIVDYGATVKDVIVEHPVYGDLTASIMVSNRKEVDEFIKKIETTNASYLSELTNGIHLHTILADNEKTLNEVCAALDQAGFLIRDDH